MHASKGRGRYCALSENLHEYYKGSKTREAYRSDSFDSDTLQVQDSGAAAVPLRKHTKPGFGAAVLMNGAKTQCFFFCGTDQKKQSELSSSKT